MIIMCMPMDWSLCNMFAVLKYIYAWKFSPYDVFVGMKKNHVDDWIKSEQVLDQEFRCKWILKEKSWKWYPNKVEWLYHLQFVNPLSLESSVLC